MVDLQQECEAVAAYVGECLLHSPAPFPVPTDALLAAFASEFTSLLMSEVRRVKKRVRAEISQGKRAYPVSLDAVSSGSLIQLAAEQVSLDAVALRLAHVRTIQPRMYVGYVTIRDEDESLRVLYPAIQQAIDGALDALSMAPLTASGRSIEATSVSELDRVTLHMNYPAFYVYEVQRRPVVDAPWVFDDRVGHDQLVALFARAYHKQYWFTREIPLIWRPLSCH